MKFSPVFYAMLHVYMLNTKFSYWHCYNCGCCLLQTCRSPTSQSDTSPSFCGYCLFVSFSLFSSFSLFYVFFWSLLHYLYLYLLYVSCSCVFSFSFLASQLPGLLLMRRQLVVLLRSPAGQLAVHHWVWRKLYALHRLDSSVECLTSLPAILCQKNHKENDEHPDTLVFLPCPYQ